LIARIPRVCPKLLFPAFGTFDQGSRCISFDDVAYDEITDMFVLYTF
jgi:hypothetical protein